MYTNILVPKRLNVGYNTYTGRLAYITYFDENGKLIDEENCLRDRQ